MLIIGRAVAGMGTSGLQSGGLTIIAASVPLEKRPGMCYTYFAIWLHGDQLAKDCR